MLYHPGYLQNVIQTSASKIFEFQTKAPHNMFGSKTLVHQLYPCPPLPDPKPIFSLNISQEYFNLPKVSSSPSITHHTFGSKNLVDQLYLCPPLPDPKLTFSFKISQEYFNLAFTQSKPVYLSLQMHEGLRLSKQMRCQHSSRYGPVLHWANSRSLGQ